MNEILNAIYERRSVRKYKTKPVDRKLVEQVIDAGRMSPSAMNKQPWYFIVLTDKREIKRLSKGIAEAAQKFFDLLHGVDLSRNGDFIFHGAPVVIFITAPRDSEWAPVDIGACAQNIMLAAKSFGLDTCPIGLARHIEHAPSLSLPRTPKGHRVYLAIALGYGDETGKLHRRKKNNLIYLNE